MSVKPVFKGIAQVGLVVKDCMAMVKAYADEYGIGPWSIYEISPDTIQDATVHGRPQKISMRIASAFIGTTQIELIQPLDDHNIYAEFLEAHGDGIHHLLFDVENYDDTSNFLQKRGAKIIQGGKFEGNEFAYLDTTKDLGLISEIYKVQPDFEPKVPDDIYPK